MVCFEDSLASEWYRIYQAMETVVESNICKWLLCSLTQEARTILKSFPGRLVVYFGCERETTNFSCCSLSGINFAWSWHEAQFVVALKLATWKDAIDYPTRCRSRWLDIGQVPFYYFYYVFMDRMIFVLVYFQPLKRKPVVGKSDGAFMHAVRVWRNFIAGTKRVIASGQYCSILPALVANPSAGFG